MWKYLGFKDFNNKKTTTQKQTLTLMEPEVQKFVEFAYKNMSSQRFLLEKEILKTTNPTPKPNCRTSRSYHIEWIHLN